MLLTKTQTVVVGNLDANFSSDFTIGDADIIQMILRDRLYEDKLRVVLQEYACNARDAHREVGTPDRPIEVYIPTKLDPRLRIRDYGPGMNPERVESVFVKFGCSTKRENNAQTGGFGIGAKCGFAYADSFVVVTVHTGMSYTYMCHKEGRGGAKMQLVGMEETANHSGTEIQINVKEEDHLRIRELAAFIFQHWKVRPTFIPGNTIPFYTATLTTSGDRWVVENVSSPEDRNTVWAVVDGIPYETTLSFFERQRGSRVPNHRCLLEFETGEVTINPNRERLAFDNRTMAILKSRLHAAHVELGQALHAEVKAGKRSLREICGNHIYNCCLRLGVVQSPLGGVLPWPITGADLGVEMWRFTTGHRIDSIGEWTRLNPDTFVHIDPEVIFDHGNTVVGMKRYLRSEGFMRGYKPGRVVYRIQEDADRARIGRYFDLENVVPGDVSNKRERHNAPKRKRVCIWSKTTLVEIEDLKNLFWVCRDPQYPYRARIPLSDGRMVSVPLTLPGRGHLLRNRTHNLVVVSNEHDKVLQYVPNPYVMDVAILEQRVQALQRIQTTKALHDALPVRSRRRSFAVPVDACNSFYALCDTVFGTNCFKEYHASINDPIKRYGEYACKDAILTGLGIQVHPDYACLRRWLRPFQQFDLLPEEDQNLVRSLFQSSVEQKHILRIITSLYKDTLCYTS